MRSIETPEKAARYIRAERFEAIFVDPSVAHFSRQGFTNLVRTSRFNSETPIVLLSASLGAFGETPPAGVSVLAKPSKSAELLPYLEALKRKLMADRRKNRRLAFRTSVNCFLGSQRLKATSVNVSATGILLEMSWHYKIGDEMELHFQLASDEPIFHGRARVVRLDGQARAGLAFQNFGGVEYVRLRRFIDAHLPAM